MTGVFHLENVSLINLLLESKPWVTQEILTYIQQKHALYKRLKVYGDNSIKEQYNKVKNKVTNMLRHAEREYYKRQLEYNKSNLAKTWDTLRMIINKKKHTKQTTTFDINGEKVSDNNIIANRFNKYFINAPKELCKQFKKQTKIPCSYLRNKTCESFYMRPTSEDEISKLLSNIKNSSPGHDDIKVEILKGIKNDILEPLTHICNLSLSSGRVPDDIKIARVVPIHKKGDRDKLCNYRPVSVLPALSKIYERLVYNRLDIFLDQHKILHDKQFGFRKKHSTSLAIGNLENKFHETVENNQFMISLFLDLSRAFDTISHEILLNKLFHYGIRGVALSWIKDYLSNRKQFVQYNQSKSKLENVEMGVPQGSILGPLLFLLYVNDLPLLTNKMSFIQFADDTSVLISGKSLSAMSQIVNTEMKLVTEWLQNNMLTLNASKSNYMIMSGQGKRYDDKNCNIFIDNTRIIRVQKLKFLGIILDDKLTWKLHIDHISSKVSKLIGIMIRARRVLGIESILTLYNTLIKPYLSYCLIIWGNTYKSYLRKIENLQKKVLRIITFSDFLAHTTPLFQRTKIMTISQLYNYFAGIHIFKCVNHILPPALWDVFIFTGTVRHPYNLKFKSYSKKGSERSLQFTGPKLWNNLPTELKLTKSLYSFKHNLKKFVLT